MPNKTILIVGVAGLLAIGGLLAFLLLRQPMPSQADIDNYAIVGDYFTLNESTANEMSMDGGTPLVAPEQLEQSAAVNVELPVDDQSAAIKSDM